MTLFFVPKPRKFSIFVFASSNRSQTQMTKFEYLLELQDSGELKLLIREFSFPTHFLSWMEIYRYHLEHPTLSQFQVALHFNVSKAKVWEVYLFMNQPIKE